MKYDMFLTCVWLILQFLSRIFIENVIKNLSVDIMDLIKQSLTQVDLNVMALYLPEGSLIKELFIKMFIVMYVIHNKIHASLVHQTFQVPYVLNA